MSGKCVDCRFWNRNGDGGTGRSYFDRAGRFHTVKPDRQRCLAILHGNSTGGDDAAAAKALAAVVDGSGYSASLETDPAFGCALFEPVDR